MLYARIDRIAAVLVVASTVSLGAVQESEEADLRGVVQSDAGPEAGVWVIAETDDLGTLFRKIVVTGDDGRFLVPDLPDAAYRVWVRGYGLVDSESVTARPGETVTLEATLAATPQQAAAVYPANYWYSLLEPPAPDEFPGTGSDGNGISPALRSQAAWVDITKQGCQLCHQMGNRFTFDISHLDGFDSAVEAWDHRVTFGQRGAQMSGVLNRFGRERGLEMFADWSDRIAAGEVPEAPPRPQGVERNVVLTMWEWAGETSYVHDEITTDKRQPTVNADGLVYGVSITEDTLVVTDTARHESIGDSHPAPRTAREGAVDVPDRARLRAVAVLGRRDHLRRAGQPAQPDDGCAGTGLADLHDPRPRQSGLVQGRLRASVGALLPGRAQRAADIGLRPGDRDVHPDRQLLRDAPPAVRRGQPGHPLVQWRPERGGLARHEAVRRDRRRAGVAGLVPDRDRHQRRRADHAALERAGRGRRPGARHPHRRLRLRRSSPTPWTTRRGSRGPGRFPGRLVRSRSGRQPAGDVHRRGLRAAVHREPRPSTRRRPGTRPRGVDVDRNGLSSGRRCPAAGTWPASTAAGAAS